MVENNVSIKLKDILGFSALKEKYSSKKYRIKLRFNTSWWDTNDKGEKLFRDLLNLYTSTNDDDKKFFNDSILSSKSRLAEGDIVFQFIEIEPHKWLFIDAVEITKKSREEKGYNTFTNSEFDVAEAKKLIIYAPFFNRLVVNWKNLPQRFFYVDSKIIDSVEVETVLSNNYLETDEEFLGYENISRTYNRLKQVIDKPSWKMALSNIYGVYVLTDVSTGKLYVGSATGDEGVYGRWKTYLISGYDANENENGEYPNKKLKELVRSEGIAYIQNNFKYSLLEIFPKNKIGRDKALQRESYWKKVFESRQWGYNDN